jgi:hypothetical protein
MRILKLCFSLAAVLYCAALPGLASGDSFGAGMNAFTIEFVDIGNPGNPADTTSTGLDGSLPRTSAGAVDYAYRMGKYEISRDTINKATAEGLVGVMLADMSCCGGNGPNRPATGVSWFEAARFVNWLNTSTGNSPAYKFDDNGNFQLWSAGDAGYNPNNLFRNRLARYVLPTVDEWYKAAFYDPTNGVYYDYATGSNTAPTPVTSGTAAGTAVYNQLLLVSGHSPADITLAGGLSPYGTMAQSGNAGEFEETEYDLVNDSPSSSRGHRVAPWFALASELKIRGGPAPTSEVHHVGFRVASVSIPEPSSWWLGAVAGAGLCGRRRR